MHFAPTIKYSLYKRIQTLVNKIKKFSPPLREKVHLWEEVPLKLIHFSPFFGQILQIYRILDLFLPLFFQILGAARAFFREEEIQKSKSGGGKYLDEFEHYLPVHPKYKGTPPTVLIISWNCLGTKK